MSLHCASPEPARHKAAALSNDRLKNAKVIAENAIKDACPLFHVVTHV